MSISSFIALWLPQRWRKFLVQVWILQLEKKESQNLNNAMNDIVLIFLENH